jgi:hypothetical protein
LVVVVVVVVVVAVVLVLVAVVDKAYTLVQVYGWYPGFLSHWYLSLVNFPGKQMSMKIVPLSGPIFWVMVQL